MPGARGKGRERPTHHPGLPRDLDDRVPIAVDERVVGTGRDAVCGDQRRSGGDRTAGAAREARHRVAVVAGLPSDLAAKPCGPAEHENLHPLISPRHRETCNPTVAHVSVLEWLAMRARDDGDLAETLAYLADDEDAS